MEWAVGSNGIGLLELDVLRYLRAPWRLSMASIHNITERSPSELLVASDVFPFWDECQETRADVVQSAMTW